MNEYEALARELIRRNIGEDRYEDICHQYGLDNTDKTLLSKLISRLKPGLTPEDNISLAEEFKDYPNVAKIMQALSLIARETAEISGFRLRGENN